jgi:hypothetical protein
MTSSDCTHVDAHIYTRASEIASPPSRRSREPRPTSSDSVAIRPSWSNATARSWRGPAQAATARVRATTLWPNTRSTLSAGIRGTGVGRLALQRCAPRTNNLGSPALNAARIGHFSGQV